MTDSTTPLAYHVVKMDWDDKMLEVLIFARDAARVRRSPSVRQTGIGGSRHAYSNNFRGIAGQCAWSVVRRRMAKIPMALAVYADER